MTTLTLKEVLQKAIGKEIESHLVYNEQPIDTERREYREQSHQGWSCPNIAKVLR